MLEGWHFGAIDSFVSISLLTTHSLSSK